MNSAQIGRYVYSTRAIGKGSFSRVYKGFDVNTDEIIAIKVIDRLEIREQLVDRLKEEISLLSSMSHPHIVEFRDFIQDRELFYIILEYCAGGDLSHSIKRGKISEAVAQSYMAQIASALAYLKHKNIVHRDLKPQNILLTADLSTIKLTDFNFAREMFDDELAETLCGSPLYMAPEIIDGTSYTINSDLWSVGLILYEMVYGKNPYHDAYNVLDLANKIKTRVIRFDDDVSPECIDLLRGLLQREPESRMDWYDFFAHEWLDLDATETPRSAPMAIAVATTTPPKIVNNYVPIGVTPPKYTRSEPAYHHHHYSHRRRSGSEKNVVDSLWSYMSSSAAALKGAVDYISSSTKS
jgi:serine/threonine protein kinase